MARTIVGEAEGEDPFASPPGFYQFHQANFENFLNYAYLQLGNRQDAEEAVQEAFLNAFRKWDLLLAADNLNALFFTMLRHRVFDQQRRRKRMSVVEASAEQLAEHQLAAEDPGLESLELRLLLEAAIRRLPERQRDVITLKYLLGLSSREVARMMGISEPTVSTHLHQARKRLTRLLDC
ncbi:RNA polymerase sigma factor [Streptomyces yangpuensis]|uniref:RNA polymerase sigma factor n=1 Tax=Streptomyces yangpuensis TaxID=1648182 RepID=UPI0036AC3A18